MLSVYNVLISVASVNLHREAGRASIIMVISTTEDESSARYKVMQIFVP